MKAALIAGLLALAGPALAGPPQWTWEAGKQTHNGAITLKSTSGSATYTGTQNPTGAVAKANQTAVTQPPTVVIQATSGGQVFNYKDDCWIFEIPGHPGYPFIGAGKIATATSKFTGVVGFAGGGQNAGFVVSLLTGGTQGSNIFMRWCGSDSECLWSFGKNGSGSTYGDNLPAASNVPIINYQKCYP